MSFFAVQWTVLLVGFTAHAVLDRSSARRTAGRVYELAALWLLVGMGAFNLWAGFGHTGPTSVQVAAAIGYAPSMFQWEIGWADIALGVLGILCLHRANRGGWTIARLARWPSRSRATASGTLRTYGHGAVPGDDVRPHRRYNLEPLRLYVLLRTGHGRIHLAKRSRRLTDQATRRFNSYAGAPISAVHTLPASGGSSRS
jgi:hypothetical protein